MSKFKPMKSSSKHPFPTKGVNKETLLQQMEEMKVNDVQWRQGKTFSYVYFASDDILSTVKEAYNIYFSENALNPSAFPSLRQMESEVIAMCADLFHGDGNTTGSMTSGGTESILMAVKTARAWAHKHKPNINVPEIILPETAHPAFHKACYYFGLKAIVIPIGTDYRAVPDEMEKAINERTVLLVGSAPSYPQGVVDPITDIAAIAKRHNLLCHVDACIGGFMLPFLMKLDYPIPSFDFAVDGVSSISADIHKYGYAAKGASVVLYKNADLRKLQFYVYTKWSGGIYGSPTMTGTRPGGAIAAAWAAIRFIGLEGYLQQAKITKETANQFKKGIEQIPELKILGNPDMTILCIASDVLDIYEIGDEMGIKNWSIDRQQMPPSLHLTISPVNASMYDIFIEDLQQAVVKAKAVTINKLSKNIQLQSVKGLQKMLPETLFEKFKSFAAKHSSVGGKRSAAMYGMMGELQTTGDLDEMIKEFLHKLLE